MFTSDWTWPAAHTLRRTRTNDMLGTGHPNDWIHKRKHKLFSACNGALPLASRRSMDWTPFANERGETKDSLLVSFLSV